MRKTVASVAVFALFAVACGGSAGEWPLEILRAEWVADGGESRAVVSGTWVRGVSTPPACTLLEGRNGEPSAWPDSGANTSPDGNSFTKEFTAGENSSLDPLPEYHVRCSVNLSTGRTLETVAPVSGEIPRG
ncbi:MAG: hypothetical protein M3494_10550 [Actinomycetota bacterium]|jgi:hypothetical protein|nr:hypothetical protein [Rubrobacter sp.]MDQ3508440.1 hypothetical protein [Actinomycetota bacterium]